MLSTLRNKADSFFFKILLTLLVASFALWGIGDMVGNRGVAEVAVVGDEVITAGDYQKQVIRWRDTSGGTLEMLQELQLFRVLLEQMVSDTLISLEASDVGIAIGDDTLKYYIKNEPTFADENGRFDRAKFDQLLRQMRMNENEYFNDTRSTLEQYIIQQTTAPLAAHSEELVAMLHGIEEEVRDAYMFVVEQPEDATIGLPDDEALRSYYDAHKQRYMAPEYRVLQYMVLDRETVKNAVSINEDDIRNLYYDKQSELGIPEKRTIEQLLYADKAKAEQAYAKFRAGDNIAEVAATVPPTNEGLTLLGDLAKDQLPAANDAVFSLSEGGFSAPVETDFGWHVFVVNAIIPPSVPSFDAMRESLQETLVNKESNMLLSQMVEQLEDAVAAGLSMKNIAESVGAKLVSTDPVDGTGKRIDRTQAVDMSKYSLLLDKGFSTEENRVSDVARLEDGGYFVVQPVQVTPKRQQALQEVKGRIVTHWQEEQTVKQTRVYGEKISKALAGVKSKDEIEQRLQSFAIAKQGVVSAKRAKVVRVTSDKINAEKTNTDLLTALFAQASPYDALSLSTYGDTAFIGGVYIGTQSQENALANESYAEIQQRTSTLYEREVSHQYLRSLRDQFPVAYNINVLNQVIEQF